MYAAFRETDAFEEDPGLKRADIKRVLSFRKRGEKLPKLASKRSFVTRRDRRKLLPFAVAIEPWPVLY